MEVGRESSTAGPGLPLIVLAKVRTVQQKRCAVVFPERYEPARVCVCRQLPLRDAFNATNRVGSGVRPVVPPIVELHVPTECVRSSYIAHGCQHKVAEKTDGVLTPHPQPNASSHTQNRLDGGIYHTYYDSSL